MKYFVTPFVGVWIETLKSWVTGINSQSHPSWVCGLKLVMDCLILIKICVTPFVGVWIETFWHCPERNKEAVTPFVGVWIETPYSCYSSSTSRVTPFVGVWIET